MQGKENLDRLLEQESRNLLKYINSVVGNHLRRHIIAEEILGEAVRYALENTGQWKNYPPRKLFVFLAWKCKMLVVDRARHVRFADKAYSKENLRDVERTHSERNTVPSPSFTLHRTQKRDAIRKYIEMLPNSDHREALHLVRLDGLTLNEAANVMGKSPEAVRKLVKRGFESLVLKMKQSKAKQYATSGETT